MKKYDFIDACSDIFNKFSSYAVAYLCLTAIGFVSGLLINVPILGIIMSLIISYFTIYTTLIVVYQIENDGKLDISKCINILKDNSLNPNKTIIKQIVKIFVVILLGIFAVLFIGLILLIGSIASQSEIGVALCVLSSISFIVIPLLVLLVCFGKMSVTLSFYVMDKIMNVDYYNNNKEYYKYIFLWNFVPVINFISSYGILIKYYRDVTEYQNQLKTNNEPINNEENHQENNNDNEE